MKNIINFFKGVAIGAGAIIPGVSSGVLCVIMGIYEPLLDKALGIFKDFRKSIEYLLPIGLGTICGIVLLGNILKYLYNGYLYQTSFIFIGLILGSLPTLLKNVKSKSNFRLKYILFLISAFLIGFIMAYLEKKTINIQASEFSFIYLLLSGLTMSLGIIIPGVSSTVILMLLGVYNIYLNSIAGIYLPVLIPLLIGVIIGSIICMKIMKILLEYFYAPTFYTIIGFSLGSIFVIYPGFTFDLNGIIAFFCLVVGFIISNMLDKLT